MAFFFGGDIPSSIAVYSPLPETFDGVKTTQVPGEKRVNLVMTLAPYKCMGHKLVMVYKV